jgi:hypothetical protein
MSVGMKQRRTLYLLKGDFFLEFNLQEAHLLYLEIFVALDRGLREEVSPRKLEENSGSPLYGVRPLAGRGVIVFMSTRRA